MTKTRQSYNDLVVDELKKKYDVTRNYILMSIRGERTGTFSIRIQEEYKKLDSASKLAVRAKINEL